MIAVWTVLTFDDDMINTSVIDDWYFSFVIMK